MHCGSTLCECLRLCYQGCAAQNKNICCRCEGNEFSFILLGFLPMSLQSTCAQFLSCQWFHLLPSLGCFFSIVWNIVKHTDSFNRLHYDLTPPLPAKGIFFPLLVNALSFPDLAWHVSPILSLAAARRGAGTIAFQGTLSRPAPCCPRSMHCSVKEGLWGEMIQFNRRADRTGKRTCVPISLSCLYF